MPNATKVRSTLINIRVNADEYTALQEAAVAGGYQSKRGSGISALLRDLGTGRVTLEDIAKKM
tara:strand:- start:33 stop:221 length:189 start_codon:yes stop_codon:yes gene_type:complete